MFGKQEERTPPPPQPEDPSGQSAPETVGVGNNEPVEPSPFIKGLLALGDVRPQDLAMVVLGERADEIVPTAEGVTFSKGERSQRHKESGASESLLELRLEHINKMRDQPGP